MQSVEDEKPQFSKLSLKQRAFIEHYLVHWNASRAAREAGYHGRVDTAAHKLMRLPQVNQAIRERIENMTMTADEVLLRLAEQARASVGDFVRMRQATITDRDGHSQDIEVMGLDWNKVATHGHLVRSISATANGPRLELYSAQDALVHIGRRLGLWIDKTALTDPTGERPYEPLSDDERASRIATLLEQARERRAGLTSAWNASRGVDVDKGEREDPGDPGPD